MGSKRYAPSTATLAERLHAMSAEDSSGCRVWVAWKQRQGYGLLKVARKTRQAHRVAYETFVGPIPEGMTVDHLCFNPSCINPEHLRLLTNVENARNQRSSYSDRCLRGHLLPVRVPGQRWQCNPCRRISYHARKQAAA